MSGTGLLVTAPAMKPRRDEDTYDHFCRLRPDLLLHHCRVFMNSQMDQYALNKDLEKRLVPQLI